MAVSSSIVYFAKDVSVEEIVSSLRQGQADGDDKKTCWSDSIDRAENEGMPSARDIKRHKGGIANFTEQQGATAERVDAVGDDHRQCLQ